MDADNRDVNEYAEILANLAQAQHNNRSTSLMIGYGEVLLKLCNGREKIV